MIILLICWMILIGIIMLQWIDEINITMDIFFFIPSAPLRALRDKLQENVLYSIIQYSKLE
jgi:hypothetical protein